MKRIIALFLAVLSCLTLVPSAFVAEAQASVIVIRDTDEMLGRVIGTDNNLANFIKIHVYRPEQFTDVAQSAWYAEGVKNAYEFGLMEGTSDTKFSPSSNITIAETVTLASRLHSIYAADNESFTEKDAESLYQSSHKWYDVYVDYAIEHGIISKGKYVYTNTATRSEFAQILYASLPYMAYTTINFISEIPDVKASEDYADAVLALYQAGILTGTDKYGTFKPNTNIQRSEVATIIARMADVSLRKKIVLEKKPVTTTPTNPVTPQPSAQTTPQTTKLAPALTNGKYPTYPDYPEIPDFSKIFNVVSVGWYNVLGYLDWSDWGNSSYHEWAYEDIESGSAKEIRAAAQYQPGLPIWEQDWKNVYKKIMLECGYTVGTNGEYIGYGYTIHVYRDTANRGSKLAGQHYISFSIRQN